MKKLILLLIVALGLTSYVKASELTAHSINEMLNEVKSTQFTYKETGLMFGYVTIKSCMYVSPKMIILKNYCSPKKNYPAKGYTFISKKFGIINFYEEQIDSVQKRDLEISTFSTDIDIFWPGDFSDANVTSINSLLEKIYYANLPACWSTNHSYYTKEPNVDCTTQVENVINFESWSIETQKITSNKTTWENILKVLNQKFTK